MRARSCAVAALLAAAPCAHAADEAGWYAQVDNDVVFGTDRWYTSGLRLARVSGPETLRSEWGALQEIYTADSRHATLGSIDRPYAGRLLAYYARHDLDASRWQTIELGLGVRGSAALGRETQDLMHVFVPAPLFDWSFQLENHFDGQATWTQTRRVLERGFALDAHYGATAGSTVDFAHAGLELRYGAIDLSEASPALRFAATPPPMAPTSDRRWGFFAGAGARYSWRNALLERNNTPGATLERVADIYRIALGASVRTGRGALTFALVQDSREFRTQRSPHRFGMLTLHFAGF